MSDNEHNWFDKPPHENTRCFRCGIKYGYWQEWVDKGYSRRVRCSKRTSLKDLPFTDLDKVTTQKIVAIDLDGTLAEYDGWVGPEYIGKPTLNGIAMCHALRTRGYKVIVYTCRNNITMNDKYKINTYKVRDTIRAWLDMHGLDFVTLSLDYGKPFAHVYLDDRGARFNPDIKDFNVMLQEVLGYLGYGE